MNDKALYEDEKIDILSKSKVNDEAKASIHVVLDKMSKKSWQKKEKQEKFAFMKN